MLEGKKRGEGAQGGHAIAGDSTLVFVGRVV
jgi:hypothetical protein